MEAYISKKTTLLLPNDLMFLPLAIQFVLQNARLRGFETDQLHKIELATEEAVSNVIRHAFKTEEHAEFAITCEQNPLGIVIIVKDRGIPFDPAILPAFDAENLQIDTPVQGLGWHLMQKTMDEVIFKNLGPAGKEIHLVKNLYTQFDEAGSGLDNQFQTPVSVPEQPETSQPQAFKIRRAKPADAVEIARCAYDAYGYSYKEFIYFPEQLSKMIMDGSLLSAVAVTANGKEEVVAHAALFFEDQGEKIAELGMAFTKRSFQGQGCGKKLGIYLVKEALKKRLRGLYGFATTSHVFSQKAAFKTGSRDCCILLGDAPASRKNQHFSGKSERGTRVYGHLNTRLSAYLKLKFKKKKIYAPGHHLEMIQKIYNNLNEKVNLIPSDEQLYELPGRDPANHNRYKTSKANR